MEKKDILKKIWNRSPQWARAFYLNMLMARKFADMKRKPQSGPLFIAGPFRSNTGIGQGARLYAYEMAKAAIPHYCLDLTEAMRMETEFSASEKFLSLENLAEMKGGCLVIHANPPQFQLALEALPESFLKTVHIRAYWVWEWEKLPPVWKQAWPYVDSIECPSHFCRKTFAQYGNVPVSVHAHAVLTVQNPKISFCKDGVLSCLCIFDAGSTFERKNPYATLEAFQRAFKKGEARLTFIVSHPNSDFGEFKKFKELCDKNPDVEILEGGKTQAELSELYGDYDIYISLHRSEGYGLTIKEAMLHGLHVVATGWSGNTDFMHGEKAHLVPYELKEKRWHKGAMQGQKGNWAEADVEQAAQILLQIKEELCNAKDKKERNEKISA